MADKVDIRREFLAERRRRASERRGDGAALRARIAALPCCRDACAVAAYMATAGEVDLDGLLDALLGAGRSVWLPRFNAASDGYELVRVTCMADDLASAAFGIREPRGALPALPLAERCGSGVLWLVPGVAFDPAGNRLGRGRGYYDRLLHDARGVRVGVAWDWQVIPQVPHTDRDESMNWIVTESRTIACGGTAG